MNFRNRCQRELVLLVGLCLCGGLVAVPAYGQASGESGAKAVSLVPQRLPIWKPSRQEGDAGADRATAEAAPQGSQKVAVSLPVATSGGAARPAGGSPPQAANAGVAAPVAPRVGGLHAPDAVDYGPALEPMITEGPGNDLTVVLPSAQQAAPQYQPRRPALWFDANYLMWWVEGSSTPALVTSGIGGSTGALGELGTEVLFPSTRVNSGMRHGFRAGGGYWFDEAGLVGIEGDYLMLLEESEGFSASGNGVPVLARPFFNIVTGQEDSHVFAYPDVASGSIDISSDSRMQAAGLWFRRAILETADFRCDGDDRSGARVDFLAGYRFMQLDEDLRIRESFEAAGPTQFDLFDSFSTENTFHGANLGVLAEFRYWAFSLELLMQLGLGHSSADVVIDGATTTATGGGAPVVSDGGLLALTTNSGSYSQGGLAAIPELGVSVGCNLTQRLRATFGYTFIYWSRVARPGEQIDRNLNPTFFPNNGPAVGAPQPEFTFVTTDLWIQGMNFGLDYRF
ncbi:MAG: BBP7 family outer membrane beta-barrel protein [Thermoguttaceae bacterium]|jgi:hypothetical protein